MKPPPMPRCLAGWKASGQRRRSNWRRDFISSDSSDCMNHCFASKHPGKSSADSFGLPAELKIHIEIRERLRRAGVVSPPAAGAHSSFDHRQAAKRSRASDRGRVHAIFISMATCLPWVASPWRGRSLGHRRAAGRLRSRSLGLGAASAPDEAGEV